MEIMITVCDVCKDNGRPSQRYTVREEASGRSATTDRCVEHAADLEEVLEAAEPVTPPTPLPPRGKRARMAKATAAKSRRRPRVVTMEEIERSKK